MTRSYIKRDILERFMSKVNITDDCWSWTAALNEWGYGIFTAAENKKQYAHRWVYKTVVEPIPEGFHIDHICRNRACVNPDHLEPVTPAENNRRATLTTECLRGHLRTPENTYIRPYDGQRQCKECGRIRLKRYRSTKQEAMI